MYSFRERVLSYAQELKKGLLTNKVGYKETNV